MLELKKTGYCLVCLAIEQGELTSQDFLVHNVTTPDTLEVFKRNLGDFIDQTQDCFQAISGKQMVQAAAELMYFRDYMPKLYAQMMLKVGKSE